MLRVFLAQQSGRCAMFQSVERQGRTWEVLVLPEGRLRASWCSGRSVYRDDSCVRSSLGVCGSLKSAFFIMEDRVGFQYLRDVL